jgi:type VI secretion system secreted protein Hcp
MAIYMKMAGVDGDVDTKGYEKWIQVNSFQWGVGRGIGSPKSSAADRESSEASVSEVTVSKTLDESTTNLLRQALWGKGKKVEFNFTRTGDDKTQIPYLKFVLTNVLLSGFSMSSGGDRPSESVSLNFTKVEISNLDSKATNEDGSPDRFEYDLSTGVGA